MNFERHCENPKCGNYFETNYPAKITCCDDCSRDVHNIKKRIRQRKFYEQQRTVDSGAKKGRPRIDDNGEDFRKNYSYRHAKNPETEIISLPPETPKPVFRKKGEPLIKTPRMKSTNARG